MIHSIVRRLILSLCLVGGLSTSAMALDWTAPLDALRGHVQDLNERLNHEDEYVEGYVVATSSFRSDDIGRDLAHWADGTVQLVVVGDSTYVQLGDDFRSGPAPDLYIYIADRKVVDETSFWNAKTVEISKLKSGSGAQYYELQENLDQHIEVVIWCKRFGAFIGAATVIPG